MFDELEGKNIDSTPLELSQEELDGISGGISIFFSGSTFEGSSMFASQRRGSRRRGGRSSTFGSSRTSSSAFQVIGLGLNSPADVMSFFSGLAGLFRRG
jgi:hypothetical protein